MILPMHEVFYIELIAYHVKEINAQILLVNRELELMCNGDNERDFQDKSNSLLNGFQNVLGHAAAISRYFWPVRKDSLHVARGQQLREIYNINDASPLYDRDVRNSIEHFDEKLDVFMESFPVGEIYPDYVGTEVKAKGKNAHFFRAYFVDRQVFCILDKEIHISPILEEVSRIYVQLDEQIATGRFLDRSKRLE